MNPNSLPSDIADYPHSSSASEIDTLSDSDWLEIISNRESDDNDSLISDGSDHVDASAEPRSRRSSTSLGSSREGEVLAWEGLVDDSSKEGPHVPQSANAAGSTLPAFADDFVPSVCHDIMEHERVNEALDQSLVSTLSASRTSGASAHNSVRDLRLSFPDPLTSSRTELTRSYDDVSPPDVVSTSDDDVPLTPESQSPSGLPCEDEPSTRDAVPEVPETLDAEEAVGVFDKTQASFEIALYGCSTDVKWSFLERLLTKAGSLSGRVLSTVGVRDSVRILRFEIEEFMGTNVSEHIMVYDRTGTSESPNVQIDTTCSDRLSLAIVYLPSFNGRLPPGNHTFYLPVFVPPNLSGNAADEAVCWEDAIKQWQSLSISAAQTVHLGSRTITPIFDCRKVDNIGRLRAYQLLRRLLGQTTLVPARSLSEHLGSVQAVTLFALLSLIVGFVINSGFGTPASAPSPSRMSAARTLWGIFGPAINRSSVVDKTLRSSGSLVTLSVKDVSVINPKVSTLALAQVTSSPSTSAAVSRAGPPQTPTQSKVGAKDMIVRTTGHLSIPSLVTKDVATTPSPPPLSFPKKARDLGETSTALSVRVAGALAEVSEVLDDKVKDAVKVVKGVRTDLEELLESLDELSGAIQRQTQAVLSQSKGKAKAVRERVRYRNDRAKGKAKELRKKGKQMIQSAGEQLSDRTKMAKKRARQLKQTIAATTAWQGYQKMHAEWVTKLREKSNDGQQRCHHRHRVRHRRCTHATHIRVEPGMRRIAGLSACE